VHHSWKQHQINTTSLLGTWCTSTWCSGGNFKPHTDHGQQTQPGALHQLWIWPLKNWGFTPLLPDHKGIHTDPPHSSGLQNLFTGSLQIFAAANLFQCLCQCLYHTWCWPIKSLGHWTFKIILNYLQFWYLLLPPPWRHLLLQGRKVMETSLKRPCLGALYIANAEAIWQQASSK